MRYLFFLLVLSITLIIFNGACFAQKDSINLDSLMTLSLEDLLKIKIKGVSKYEEISEKSPASVIVITATQIKENGYHDLSDILKKKRDRTYIINYS